MFMLIKNALVRLWGLPKRPFDENPKHNDKTDKDQKKRHGLWPRKPRWRRVTDRLGHPICS
jgi:hypothetical protein